MFTLFHSPGCAVKDVREKLTQEQDMSVAGHLYSCGVPLLLSVLNLSSPTLIVLVEVLLFCTLNSCVTVPPGLTVKSSGTGDVVKLKPFDKAAAGVLAATRPITTPAAITPRRRNTSLILI